LRKSQDNPKGGIVEKEFGIQASKVMLQEKFQARQKKRGVVTTPTQD
jgi:ribosomal protein L24